MNYFLKLKHIKSQLPEVLALLTDMAATGDHWTEDTPSDAELQSIAYAWASEAQLIMRKAKEKASA